MKLGNERLDPPETPELPEKAVRDAHEQIAEGLIDEVPEDAIVWIRKAVGGGPKEVHKKLLYAALDHVAETPKLWERVEALALEIVIEEDQACYEDAMERRGDEMRGK